VNKLIKLMSSVVISGLLASILAPQATASTVEFISQYNRTTGEVTVMGCKSQCPSTLAIPSSIDGMPVTRIWAHAFESANLDSVSIPDSVTYISNDAFANNNLGEVYIPRLVNHIGRDAFAENYWLYQVSFEGDAPQYDGAVFSRMPDVMARKLTELRVNVDAVGWESTWGGVKVNATTFVSSKITGKPQVNKTLSAVGKNWRYSLSPTFKYQWFACTTQIYEPFVGDSTPSTKRIPKTCTAIKNATKRTFKLTTSQKGKYITVRITGQLNGWATTSLIAWTTGKISK
jgi:BspA type Leucine rich repeat region (6 copies)